MQLRKILFALAAWACAACACLYFTPAASAGWGASCAGPVGPQFSIPPLAYRPAAAAALPAGRNPHCPCSAACTCGCQQGGDCPCCGYRSAKAALPGDAMPTGVVAEKIDPGERYSVNGHEVAGVDAARALQASPASVPDDSDRPSLTAIGTPEECAKVKADLQAAGVLDLVLWQDYRPSDVMVARYGFVTGGHPEIYLEAPDGKDALRQDAYEPKTLIAEVRKKDPKYDPKKDPSGASADPLGAVVAEIVVEIQKAPWWAWVGAGVLGFIALRRRK